MTLRATCLALLALLHFLPATQAQTAGQAQAFVSLPHGVELSLGPNDVSMRVVAQLTCQDGFEPPGPLQVNFLYGGDGPVDDAGPAWEFTRKSWTLNWTVEGTRYAIDEVVDVPVLGHGFAGTGASGEFGIGISAFRDARATVCTANGYSVPLRSGHAHIQVGPRPLDERGSPVVAPVLLGLALIGLAFARR